jgi:hypothetical protein
MGQQATRQIPALIENRKIGCNTQAADAGSTTSDGTFSIWVRCNSEQTAQTGNKPAAQREVGKEKGREKTTH